MGLRHTDAERAQRELEHLFAAQWQDGRVPQIVYNVERDDDYSPGASFWHSTEIPEASHLPSAGLIQPPNHAWAAWQIHQADPELSERRSFLESLYPKLLAWHAYLERARDRCGSQLACIVHPWESGMDNSPLWDEALAQVPDNPQTSIRRPDLQHAATNERPGTKEYGRYFWLAERYRDHNCDDADVDYPFLMEDPTVNALWALSELALVEIAATLKIDPRRHRDRAEAITTALSTLFDDELGQFTARDVNTGKLVHKATVSGLLPAILPGLPEAPVVIAAMLGPKFLGSGAVMLPSYDATAVDHNRSMYWRGPAWFNTTWLAAKALVQHGHPDSARKLEDQIVRLAVEHNFPEYVDPWDGTPHGTRRFSWTAALAIDILSSRR